MATQQQLTPDPHALPPKVYHRVVGPVLQVCADLAARRGDPTLHADLPVMLALVDLIARFADLYQQYYPDSDVDPQTLRGAPAGAAVMVLQQAGLERADVDMCLKALEQAYRQAHEADILDAVRPMTALAWVHLEDDQRDQAGECLFIGAQTIIAAVEQWRKDRVKSAGN